MKKRIVSIMLTICMLIGAASMLAIPTSAASEDYWTDYASASLSGSGTEGNPFLIGSAEDLAKFAADLMATAANKNAVYYEGKYFKLTADIDLAGHIWHPAGGRSHIFGGIFDGDGHIIRNMTATSSTDEDGDDGVALIGAIGNNAVVKNVILLNATSSNSSYCGGLVGLACTGTNASDVIAVENSYVQATISNPNTSVKSETMAGLVCHCTAGSAGKLVVNNCVFDGSITAGTVSGSSNIGGIVGNGNGKLVEIRNCLNLGNLSGYQYIAGILGRQNANATIENCINVGTVTAKSDYASEIVSCGTSKDGSRTINNCFGTNSAPLAWMSGRTSGGDIIDGTTYTGKGTTDGKHNSTVCADITVNSLIGTDATYPNGTYIATTWTKRNFDIMVPITHAATRAKLPHSSQYRSAPNIDVSWYTEDMGATEFDISTLSQLRGLAAITSDKAGAVEKYSFAGCTINLISDIDMSVMTDKWIMIGDYTVGGFAGTFDGNGHTIRGLTAEVNSGDFGLFGALVEEAIIQNLKIEGFEISGATTGDVGALVSSTKFSTVQEDACLSIDNVYVNATINTPNTGSAAGFVAAIGKNGKLQGDRTAYMSISNSVFTGSVTGKTNVAGFIGNGNNVNIAIADCLNAGTITASTNKSSFAAGIVARQDNYVHADNGTGETTIERCINIGKISGANITREIVGAGTDPKANYLASTLTNCYGVLPTVLLSRNANVDENGNPSGATEYDVEIESLVGTTAIFPNGLDSTWTTVNGSVIVPSGVELLATELLYKPQLQYGASVRLAADSGLRFHGTINKEWADEMGETIGACGMIIAPVKYITAAGAFTPEALEALGEGKYVNVVATKYQNNSDTTGDYWDFTIAITNIKAVNLGEKLAARSYVIIDGQMVFSDYYEADNARSVDEVATAALNDTKAIADEIYCYEVTVEETTVYSCYSDSARAILESLKKK